jgi:hypothetical protein
MGSGELKVGKSAVDQSRRLSGAFVGEKRDLVTGLSDLRALMADFRKGEAIEGGDVFGEHFEDILDLMDLVRVAGDGEQQVAEDFPIVVRLTLRFDGAVEALEAAGEIDHGAALFGEGGGG